MSELGRPREFSGRRGGPGLRLSKGVVTVALAVLVLLAVLLAVSACIPTP